MNIIIAGGGTGGHAFPALQIALELKKIKPDLIPIMVGEKNSIEERLACEHNISFISIPSKPLVGKSFWQKIIGIFYLFLSIFFLTVKFIKNRPLVVIGVGGYVSAPSVIAAFLLRIKRAICEQNAVPGLTNKWLAYISNAVFISFEYSKKYFSNKNIILSGNPIRKDFINNKPIIINKLNILISGGSKGAGFLNINIPKIFANIKNKSFTVTHQTGEKDLELVRNFYIKYGIEAQVVAFIKDMPKAFLTHNLLISRAGATIIAELCAFGMPSILIPYRFSHGHQRYNALAIEKSHGGIMLEEQDRDFSNKFSNLMDGFISDPNSLEIIGQNARKLARIDAGSIIANYILNELK